MADVDVISGGGSLSNLLPVAGSNGVQYTATYTAGSAAGDVIIGVDAGKFADATGNINNDTYKGNATGTSAVNNTTAEANNWVQLTNTGANDTTAPTVVVTRMGSGTVGSAGETMVFTLSEASTDFVMGDVSVMGGSLTNWAAVPDPTVLSTAPPSSLLQGPMARLPSVSLQVASVMQLTIRISIHSVLSQTVSADISSKPTIRLC